jgi:hypothetical protein
VETEKAGNGVMPGVAYVLFGARLAIVIPKNWLEMAAEGLAGASVFTSGLSAYANDPATVPCALAPANAKPLRLITAVLLVEELLAMVILPVVTPAAVGRNCTLSVADC